MIVIVLDFVFAISLLAVAFLAVLALALAREIASARAQRESVAVLVDRGINTLTALAAFGIVALLVVILRWHGPADLSRLESDIGEIRTLIKNGPPVCADSPVRCLGSREFRLLEAKQVGKFAPGSACAGTKGLEETVSAWIQEIREIRESGELRAVLVSGSFDYRPFRHTGAEFARSNIVLASARAHCARERLREAIRKTFGVDDEIPIQTFIDGPAMNGSHVSGKPAGALDGVLETDRSVRALFLVEQDKDKGAAHD